MIFISIISKIKDFIDLRIIVRNRAFWFVYDKYDLSSHHINYGLSASKDETMTKLLEFWIFIRWDKSNIRNKVAQNLKKYKNVDK